MLHQPAANAHHAVDSGHGYAMLVVMVGSIVISFGGLVQRNIELSNPRQIDVYRSIGMLLAIALIIMVQNRGRFFARSSN